MRTSEDEIRQVLRHRADRFDMPPEPSPRIVREVRRRRSRNGVLAGIESVALVAAVAVTVILAGLTRTAPPPHVAMVDRGSVVTYVMLGATSPGEGTKPPVWLTDHIACMRAHGFDLPD